MKSLFLSQQKSSMCRSVHVSTGARGSTCQPNIFEEKKQTSSFLRPRPETLSNQLAHLDRAQLTPYSKRSGLVRTPPPPSCLVWCELPPQKICTRSSAADRFLARGDTLESIQEFKHDRDAKRHDCYFTCTPSQHLSIALQSQSQVQAVVWHSWDVKGK